MTANEVLKQYFGYDTFRPGQEELITAVLNGRDVLAVMPTGSGKSICYQVPALMMPGITLVISPLISLMQDQVKALNDAGIHAAYINSSLSENQIRHALILAADGTYKIIYVAPERLESAAFRHFAEHADISLLAVDEAHCISQWGQDFRPSYMKIVDFIQNLPERPVIGAFTATATKEVQGDIRYILGLQEPEEVILGYDRPNLYFEVRSVRKKDAFVLDYIRRHSEDSGIIYCATRKNVDNLFTLLFKSGVSVARYHAGMDVQERKQSQDDFVYDRISVMVATNAFGMGIDKSNVRFVIHYNMPQSMENYYQEAGRAGRDGEDARCILLFSPQDVMINRFLLEKKDFQDVDSMDIATIEERDEKRLRQMENYCYQTGCLRNYILRYFGEHPAEDCGNCGNCQADYEEEDLTAQAKWVINCVYEAQGRYGMNIITGTLIGANWARLREIGATDFRSYGKLKDTGEPMLKELIRKMLQEQLLIQTDGKYAVLKIGPEYRKLKDDSYHVVLKIRKKQEMEAQSTRRKKSTDDLTSLGFTLFEKLRGVRTKLAQENHLPPYIIFSDKTLIDMCVRLPKDQKEMLNVSGVGMAKFEKYGQQFLSEILTFISEHTGETISTWSPEADEQTDRKNRTKKKTALKPDFSISPEDAENFPYSDAYMVSEICRALNDANQNGEVKNLPVRRISEFLLEQGYITEKADAKGDKWKYATEKGEKAGILTEKRKGKAGNIYLVLKYPKEIQHEVVEHFIRKEGKPDNNDEKAETDSSEEKVKENSRDAGLSSVISPYDRE